MVFKQFFDCVVYGYVAKLHSNRLRANDRHLQERDKFSKIELAEHYGSAAGYHCLPKYPSRYCLVKRVFAFGNASKILLTCHEQDLILLLSVCICCMRRILTWTTFTRITTRPFWRTNSSRISLF